MEHVLVCLARGLRGVPNNRTRLLDVLSGKVRYGCFPHDPTIAARSNGDGTETYGRYGASGEFIPCAVRTGVILPFAKHASS